MMVQSWIMKTLSPQIAESVMYLEDAQELWEELKERFSKGDHFKFSDLLQEIHSIRQGERSVSQFFTDLKILWEELEFLRPIPRCSCNIPCSVDLSKAFHKYREMEHVICFLKGLNECYNTVRTQILLMEPLPNINRVFSLIMQQERQGKHEYGLTNQNEIKPRERERKKSQFWNNIQEKIGQSNWGSASAYTASVETQTSQQNNDNVVKNSLTPEQMKKILQIIEKIDSPAHNISQIHKDAALDRQGLFSWIIDTRVTDHVTHDKE
ncbi:uncharacterized protein LOC124843482 [Vigna umbellata]|uniref:uncharacterized protein LOC124843482 n=1 Tax=Vigna umbellata TaxID=87088 RepID=UPI001F5F61D5|nr:uncharacterized protein LOC124843482 [Vigna umbellata]